jgi:diguanylate cyclase (GGDEF)-like protein
VFDIDHFRNVNDTIGPDAADALLKAVVSRLEPIIRRGDTLARIGGDEFGLLITQTEGFSVAASMAERIQGAFRDPWTVGGVTIQATASLGFASYSDDTRNAQNLLDNADVAMRRAKTLGRDTCQFFDPTMNVEVAERLQMEREFRVALGDEQLRVYYQPQIDLRDGLIVGAEALVRWSHPERGIILPAEFVPLAEGTGLISRLDS